MLLPEDGLDTLLTTLSTLPTRDRRAVLARLNFHERQMVAARMRAVESTQTAAKTSPDSGEGSLLDQVDDAAITPAARTALRDVIEAQRGPSAGPIPAAGASLTDTFARLLQRPVGRR